MDPGDQVRDGLPQTPLHKRGLKEPVPESFSVIAKTLINF
jgi:hypothetical protein